MEPFDFEIAKLEHPLLKKHLHYRISHSNSACYLLEILVKSHPYSAWANRDHTTTQPEKVKITVKVSQDEFRCVDNTRYLFPVEAILKHPRKKQSHFQNRNTVEINDNFFERSLLHFVKDMAKNSSRQLLENIERLKRYIVLATSQELKDMPNTDKFCMLSASIYVINKINN